MTEGGIVKICDAYTSARMALDHSQIVVEALHGVIKNAKEDEIDDSLVHVPGAKFPLAWNAEYYAVRQVSDKERVTCKTCEGTGKVRLPSPTGDVYREYDCPECECEKEITVAVKTEYRVVVCRLRGVERDPFDRISVRFKFTNHNGWVDLSSADELKEMVGSAAYDGMPVHIYQAREEAQSEADRLNGVKGGESES